jgi:hypothetical protein
MFEQFFVLRHAGTRERVGAKERSGSSRRQSGTMVAGSV